MCGHLHGSLLATMRHNEACKKFECEHFCKETQTEQGEGGSFITGTNGPTTSEPEVIYVAGVELRNLTTPTVRLFNHILKRAS